MNNEDQSFWFNAFANLTGNFFSDILLAMLAFALWPRIVERIRPARLKLVVAASLVKRDPLLAKNHYVLDLVLQNDGRTVFEGREVYWQIYMDAKLIVVQNQSSSGTVTTIPIG